MKAVQNKQRTKTPSGLRAFFGQIFTGRSNSESYSANRFSVLYMRHDQYQQIGCDTQEEAQLVQGMLLTDGDRIPVGIYDSKNDSFEWEIVGEYLAGRGSDEHQRRREEAILTIARSLRRRDGSWHPAYLQRPSFFA